MVNQEPQSVHRIDSGDMICYVNDAWRSFAEENDCPKLPQQVMGTPLWRWIAGDETRLLLHQLLTAVRGKGDSIELPFRCDSASIRRFLRLQIQPLPDDGIEFRSWIQREELFPEPVILLDPNADQDCERLLQMCSWCKSVQVDERWLALEEAIERMRLFDSPPIPLIDHSICPKCYLMVLAEAG